MTVPNHQLARFRKNREGATILEFALIAPVLLAMLIGIAQLGMMFYAQAGLKSSVEDAARFATLWPKPSEAQIKARITANRFGMDPANIVGPTVTFGTSSSQNSVTVSMGYNVTINFVLGQKTIELSETRTAFVVS